MPAAYISLAKSRGRRSPSQPCSTIGLLYWHRQTCYYSLPSPMSLSLAAIIPATKKPSRRAKPSRQTHLKPTDSTLFRFE